MLDVSCEVGSVTFFTAHLMLFSSAALSNIDGKLVSSIELAKPKDPVDQRG